MVKTGTIREALPEDKPEVDAFLKSTITIHRHLDWRKPTDWIGRKPFLIQESSGKIQSLLVAPADPVDIYWLRVLATQFLNPIDTVYQELFPVALATIRNEKPDGVIVSLAYLPWMRALLERNGWRIRQRVVQLNWTHHGKHAPNLAADGVFLRKMTLPDVAEVAQIDHDCFEAIWRHSEDAILQAYQQNTYSTVAEKGGRIVGYQITTQQRSRAHIARLAVRPDYQHSGIGQALVNDTIERFRRPWTREISVNTQEDNEKSLRLYQKLGFELSDESFPIYIYPG